MSHYVVTVGSEELCALIDAMNGALSAVILHNQAGTVRYETSVAQVIHIGALR